MHSTDLAVSASATTLAATPAVPRLAARGLTKRYGDVVALNALDLTINAGEVYCLLGANGAGKSTTINLFLNFVAPTAGDARA